MNIGVLCGNAKTSYVVNFVNTGGSENLLHGLKIVMGLSDLTGLMGSVDGSVFLLLVRGACDGLVLDKTSLHKHFLVKKASLNFALVHKKQVGGTGTSRRKRLSKQLCSTDFTL